MKIKTSELSGVTLDYAVAMCEGLKIRCILPMLDTIHVMGRDNYNPSSNWSLAGPIIEREKICVGFHHQCDPTYHPLIDEAVLCWARTTSGGYLKVGPSPLIAAMRCYVASKLGDEVDIPEELDL